MQWRSDAHHGFVYIFVNLVGDVIAISISTRYDHIFYPMRSEEEILRHVNTQHHVLIVEVVQHDISKQEPRLLRTKYLWIRQEFSATLMKYMAMPMSTVDFGEILSLRTLYSTMKPALHPEATAQTSIDKHQRL